jgi:hypothetical protein
MKKITIAAVRQCFPALMSPCCRAAVSVDNLCRECGRLLQVPIYFMSDHGVDDAILQKYECELRAALPHGATVAMWVNN